VRRGRCTVSLLSPLADGGGRMKKNVVILRGIAIPVRDYEEDFLYLIKEGKSDGTSICITDFFPEAVPASCCDMYGKECDNAECKYRDEDGICRLPRYYVHIIIEYERLDGNDRRGDRPEGDSGSEDS